MTDDKPVPSPDPDTIGYWTALRDTGVLHIQQCQDCQYLQHFPRSVCGRCGLRTLTFVPVSGEGEVYSYVTTYHPVVKGFGELPYVTAWVELREQEGLRVLANIVDCPVAEVSVGLPVRLTVEERGGWLIPQFTCDGKTRA